VAARRACCSSAGGVGRPWRSEPAVPPNPSLTAGEIHELREELSNPKMEKKKDAVKKVIAAMTVGKDVSMLFTDVVNCIQTVRRAAYPTPGAGERARRQAGVAADGVVAGACWTPQRITLV